jgi:hypothetical protein
MPLVRPFVVGPISTISRAVRVRGQRAGAQVLIVSLGPMRREVAKGIAGSADDRIRLGPTETLRADDVLYAIQEVGGQTSPKPNVGDPLGVPVQPTPTVASALTLVTFSSILFTCGRAVWLRGGVPGALGRLQRGGADLGSGTFEDEEGARFGVSPMLVGGSVQARQSISGVGDGPALSRAPLDLPGPARGPLAAPNIDPIPVACNTSVLITQVFDGAEVTLRRGDDQPPVDLQFMFDAPALWAPVGKPLSEGEVLTVSQAVHAECSRAPTPRSVRVDRAPPIPKPIVAGPLCSGGPLIHLDGLIPGAGIEIMANGKVYQAQTPPQATSLDAIIDPLAAPAAGQSVVVTARQEQCGVFGPESDPTPVDPLPGAVPQHEIIPPLLACSPIVRVANAHPGATLMAFSDVFGPISGFVRADAAGHAVINVAPQLVGGHVVEVRQWACGGAPINNFRAVEFIESLPIPAIGDAFVSRNSIDIGDLVPGATVEVVVTAKEGVVKEVGLFVADDRLDTANLQSPLADGDKVKARQGLCQTLTGYSSERVTIVEPIRADWWQWSGANPRNETWKEEYVASGIFTNKGGTKIQDFAVTIFEDAANVGATNHALVAPSQSVPGATPPIKKDWQWFVPGVWVVKGPLHKTFHYKALISAKDVTGNPYPTTASADLIVFVNVSKLKRTSGAYAMGAAASAAAMAASIVLIVAGGAAYAAAAIAGAVALDPPEPDPNFRERIPLPPLGDVPAGQEHNVIRLFRLGERVMLIELTKSLIEGRRLGALAEDDQGWVETHAQDLAEARALQRSLATEIGGLARAAKQEVLALAPQDMRPERRRLQATGLTTALANQMQLPESLRSGFDALLRSDVALPDPDIAAAIDETVAAVTEFARDLD